MANELTKLDNSTTLALYHNNELTDLLKPLKTEIFLFDTFIAGTTHVEEQERYDDLKPDQVLQLRRENNKYDPNAILVLNNKGEKLGYVPEKDNIIFARLMDAGKILNAKVKDHHQKGTYHIIPIEIYLIDF